MSLSTFDTVFLSVGLISFGGSFIWIGVALHLAYTSLDEMLSYLKNCSIITNFSFFRHTGPQGKLVLVGGISSIVTFPWLYHRYGTVSIEDVDAFPEKLKRKLVLMQWAQLGLSLSLISLYAVGKLTGEID